MIGGTRTSRTSGEEKRHLPPILRDVVREHLEEVGFLSIQRRKLLFSSEIPLDGLTVHDGRIEAHWDGLVVGRPVSVALALDNLGAEDPWDLYAAARVWLELGEPDPVRVADRIEKADEALLPAWREALRRIPRERLEQLFPEGRSADEPPPLAGLLVFARGWHGLLPGHRLPGLARSDDPSIRFGAARALGWGASGPEADRILEALRDDPDPAVRRAALWSSALIDPAGAAELARRRLRAGEADFFTARVLGLLGTPEDAELLAWLLDVGEAAPAAVRAMGDLGGVKVVPPLIELLGDGEARVRQAAWDALQILLGEVPLAEAAEATGEDERETPDPSAVKEFWAGASGRFDGGRRRLRGRTFPWDGPQTEEPMEFLWRSAVLFRRPDLAWLRREAPDGFFTAEPTLEAVPGD